MAEMQNTVTTYTAADGEEIKMTLCFALLYRAKAKYPSVYERYNAIMMKGMNDIFDAATILYIGYLCANIDEVEVVSYEAFLEKLGDDVMGVMTAATRLLGRKKKVTSATHS